MHWATAAWPAREIQLALSPTIEDRERAGISGGDVVGEATREAPAQAELRPPA